MPKRGRPKTYSEERRVKALRLPVELDERLRSAADEYGVSVNVLINRAIEDYLVRLRPVEELLPVATPNESAVSR